MGFRSPEQRNLETDYTAWLRNYYPRAVSRPMGYFHREFWSWLWQLEADKPHPEYDAGFAIWFRGAGKTTSGQLAVAVVGAKKLRRYGWLLSRTQAQANQKLLTIRSAISRMGSDYLRAYPHMAKAQTETGQNLGWNTTRLVCGGDDDRFVIESIGLDMAVRGANVEFQRPDFLMPDDIDALHDSPYMVGKNIETLTQSILLAGSDTMAVLGLQNLIHQDSIFAQIADGRAKFLRNRIIFGGGPVPAFEGDFQYEERETGKGPRFFITSGVPSWPEGFGLAEAEKELNEVGPDAFEAEDQHEVSRVHSDATFREFDPVYHCVTVSEFMRFYSGQGAVDYNLTPIQFTDRLTLPRGECAMAQDWGNNTKHPVGLRWLWRPGEGVALSDSLFFLREQCWPTFPPIQNDPRATPSYGQVHKAILEVERELGMKAAYSRDDLCVTIRLNSHERPEAAVAYRKDYGTPLSFEQINTNQAREGILHLQELHHINKLEAHPFRIDPRSDTPWHRCEVCGWEHAGSHLQGRPRAFYLVANGQGELRVDRSGKLVAAPAIDEHGQARTRWEYPRHRPKHSTEGEEKEAPKRDDEMVDTDRALVGRVNHLIKALTPAQRAFLLWKPRLAIIAAIANPVDRGVQEMTAQMRLNADMAKARRGSFYDIGAEEQADDEFIDGMASGRGF